MKHPDDQFTIEELENLCCQFLDCQLTMLEETELEYVLMHCDFQSPLINETKRLIAVSLSLKLDGVKLHKSTLTWAMRIAACVAIVLGTCAIFNHINLNSENYDCIVYVSGEKANAVIAHKIAEADVAKMQRFMQVVREQRATEEAKVEQFMNQINKSK